MAPSVARESTLHCKLNSQLGSVRFSGTKAFVPYCASGWPLAHLSHAEETRTEN
jgi:hypothetical protein